MRSRAISGLTELRGAMSIYVLVDSISELTICDHGVSGIHVGKLLGKWTTCLARS